MRLLIDNANVFDTETLSFRGETSLVCEGNADLWPIRTFQRLR